MELGWGKGRAENAEKRESSGWWKASRLHKVTDQRCALNSPWALPSIQFNNNDVMGGDEVDMEMFMKEMTAIKRKFGGLLLRNCTSLLETHYYDICQILEP